MTKTLLLAGVAVSLFAANANALDYQQYVSVKALYSDSSTKIKDEDETTKLNDNVWGAALAYGVKRGAIRTELELNLNDTASKKIRDFEDFETEKNSLEKKSVMINGYYDIETGTKFTPYVGAGLGFAHLKFKHKTQDEIFSKSKNHLAWQLGAGVSYAATDTVSVDLGYRYINYGTFKVKGTDYWEEGSESWSSKIKTHANEFYLGVRYAF